MNVLLFGGGGFVGRHLAAHLTAQGHQVGVYTRYLPGCRDLLVLPGLRLLSLQGVDRSVLLRQMVGVDAVVNLVGTRKEGRTGDFARAHVDFPRELAELCTAAQVPKVIHVSAAGAGPEATSRFLRSKWQGESAMAAGFPGALILRPTLLFGPDDPFTKWFVDHLRRASAILPIPCADVELAPLHVGDFIRVVEQGLTDRKGPGRYDLCGPQRYRLDTWVEYFAQILGVRVRLLPLGPRISRWHARISAWLPGGLCTLDEYYTLSAPSCAGAWPDRFLPVPAPAAAVLPRCIA